MPSANCFSLKASSGKINDIITISPTSPTLVRFPSKQIDSKQQASPNIEAVEETVSYASWRHVCMPILTHWGVELCPLPRT